MQPAANGLIFQLNWNSSYTVPVVLLFWKPVLPLFFFRIYI